MSAAPLAPYPALRLRRVRQADWTRRLVRETTLTPSDLIWSVVVHEGGKNEAVTAMPGVERLSMVGVGRAAREARDLGIPAIAVFPHIDGARKDALGSAATDPTGLIARAVKTMKDAAPEVGILCDVALDSFTDHGHDGVIENGKIHNDATVERLVEQGLMQARAGCDILAPSDMMDGRVGALRAALESDGFVDTMIMSYAAKYASAFYGPYREAIGSAKLGAKGAPADKATYQMDPGNGDEALRGCPRYRRGCGYGDDQARPALSRYRPPSGGGVRHANLRLSGVGGIRHDPRRRPGGGDRGGSGGSRELDRLQARRRRGRPHLFRSGGGPFARRLKPRR